MATVRKWWRCHYGRIKRQIFEILLSNRHRNYCFYEKHGEENCLVGCDAVQFGTSVWRCRGQDWRVNEHCVVGMCDCHRSVAEDVLGCAAVCTGKQDASEENNEAFEEDFTFITMEVKLLRYFETSGTSAPATLRQIPEALSVQ